jgi:hypothetical protein
MYLISLTDTCWAGWAVVSDALLRPRGREAGVSEFKLIGDALM